MVGSGLRVRRKVGPPAEVQFGDIEWGARAMSVAKESESGADRVNSPLVGRFPVTGVARRAA